MARIGKEEKERIRNKIIEVSKRNFVEYGYDKTSINTIAKAVGIANGTIFNYFESKEEIYLATIISNSSDIKTTDLTLEKKGCINEQLIKMLEDDVMKSLSLEKEVLAEIIFVSLKLRKRKEISFSDLVNLDRSYIDKIESVLNLHGYDNARLASEIIYNNIISECLLYLYTESVSKTALLKEIQNKTLAILNGFQMKDE
ncbi:TetR/AcrR family transcriptional regulator [Clostridium sp.]|uniref:TetR/AcrR family transcriptional regulator n=1 Tax=Clostridium sp. TaxID=1506 RepID=UPI003F4BF712